MHEKKKLQDGRLADDRRQCVASIASALCRQPLFIHLHTMCLDETHPSTMKAESSAATRYVGNALHVLNLVEIAAYGASMVFLISDGNFFDPLWLEDGFCLPNRDVPYLTTHDLSGYAIIAISILGLALHHALKKRSDTTSKEASGLELANTLAFWAMIGAIGHGVGHMLISHGKRRGFFPEGNVRGVDSLRGDSNWMILAKIGPAYLFFWIPLIKTYMINTSQNKAALIALVVLFGSLQLPTKFGFAYTQMILFSGLSLDQLFFVSAKNKGFEYALWPAITVLPSTALSFLESTRCTTSFVMHEYGHVVYDAFMAFSYVLYYLICWTRVQSINTGAAKTD